jgi:diguanylate cyclase (GGDEF)-like protein
MTAGNIDLKVLVVEDSRVAMMALCNHLDKIGIQPLFKAANGQEALDIYRLHHPDIILLDGLLPDIDGFEVARQIRAIEKHMFEVEGRKLWSAIIFLTGMDNDDDLAHGIEAGGDDYLTKPVSLIVLSAKINAMRRLIEMQRTNAAITQQLNEVVQQLNQANRELQVQSTIDKLTGISNRRMFDESLQKEWRRCARLKMPISLAMMDVDFFKQYNDTYGHQAGDHCLQEVAKQLASSVRRPSDLAARYGGEEFALILGLTDVESACLVSNRARELISNLKITHVASATGYLTVSCGIATLIPDEHSVVENLIKAADGALYQAKKQGRNTVICANEPEGLKEHAL